MFMYFPPASDQSLSRLHARRTQRGQGVARVFPLLMLVWSVWLFITPLYEPQFFPHWLWPTLLSYAVFLILFHGAYFRDRRYILHYALGIALLGFLLTPVNPGAQTYIIYACAFLAFRGAALRVILTLVSLLALYAAEWIVLGWPLIYLVSTVMVGLAVGLMNLSFAQKARADAALMLSHEEVRRLASLAERERIGRDLHDLLGHTLSLVALKSDLAGRLLERDVEAARREVDDVSRVAREALAQVRHAVTGIRATGLTAELASARLLLEADGVALDVPHQWPPLDAAQETELALILREAITNLQRHARASAARIRLEVREGHIVLEIEDNGRGGAIVPGNGVAGMRERLRQMGGELHLHSRPGQGTRVEARVPLTEREGPGAALKKPTPDEPEAAA